MSRPADRPASRALLLVRRGALACVGAALLVRALWSSAEDLRPALASARAALGATQHPADRRWEPVRPLLPPRGRVQYVWKAGNDLAPAFQAQFALVPLVLTPEPVPGALVLVDEASHRDGADLAARGFLLVRVRSEGISLWQPAR